MDKPATRSVIGVVLLLLTACSAPPPSAPVRPEKPVLRVGVGNVVETAPLRIAVVNREFDRAGLRVELVEEPSSANALTKLRTGELDVAFAGDVALFKAVADGQSLRLQTEAYTSGPDTMALVILPDSGYTNPADKRAPTIAVDPADDLSVLAVKSVLGTVGVDRDAIKFSNTEPAGMMRALRDGKADAAWLREPEITRAQRESGARVLVDGQRGATEDFPVSSYAAATDFAVANPRTLTVFRTVLSAAQQRADDPSLIRRELPKVSPIGPPDAALVALGGYPVSLSGVRLQRVADLMHAAGLLPGRLDVQPLLP